MAGEHALNKQVYLNEHKLDVGRNSTVFGDTSIIACIERSPPLNAGPDKMVFPDWRLLVDRATIQTWLPMDTLAG
jgi:hypothetical protein